MLNGLHTVKLFKGARAADSFAVGYTYEQDAPRCHTFRQCFQNRVGILHMLEYLIQDNHLKGSFDLSEEGIHCGENGAALGVGNLHSAGADVNSEGCDAQGARKRDQFSVSTSEVEQL